MTSTRFPYALGCALLWLLVLLPSVARARPVDVTNEVDGIPLAPRVSVLADPSGALRLSDVMRPELAARFKPSNREMRFGFAQTGTLWLRFEVQNRGDDLREWLLEVGYPMLDLLTLYVPLSDGGYAPRPVGDTRPFAQRELIHNNFMFQLEEPGHTTRTYYLSVSTKGTLAVPLRAWTVRRFTEHQFLSGSFLFAFYGVTLVMCAYNGVLFALTRISGYGYLALLAFSNGLAQLSLGGHAFQLILPMQPRLAEYLAPVSMNFAVLCNCLFARHHVNEEHHFPHWFLSVVEHLTLWLLGTSLVMLVVPFQVAVLISLVNVVAIIAVGCVVLVFLRIVAIHYPHAPSTGWVDTLALGWLAVFVGTLSNALLRWEVLPENAFTVWGGQVGVIVQLVLVAASMSGRLNWLRAQVAKLNAQLASKVQALANAIGLAETEAARAASAGLARDEVIATMSHELRTPLNAIINVPQGIIQNFPEVHGACCSHCAACFELEPDELLAPARTCPECHTVGALQATVGARYEGQPERTLKHLTMIEKAGQHLLQVVNGILEGTQRAGAELKTQQFDALPVLRDTVDQMSVIASASGVTLELKADEPEMLLRADALKLRQILINLIGNAIKFSAGRGVVTVAVSRHGSQCLFHVRDQGIGIAKEKQAAIFESFEQSHDKAAHRVEGTGLGLSIVRSLVRLHGGEIWVESEFGQGSTFSFCIPAT